MNAHDTEKLRKLMRRVIRHMVAQAGGQSQVSIDMDHDRAWLHKLIKGERKTIDLADFVWICARCGNYRPGSLLNKAIKWMRRGRRDWPPPEGFR